MILLWGLTSESTFGAVLEQLTARGAEAVLLDQGTPGGAPRPEVDITVADRHLTGEVAVAGRRVSLADVSAAYLRPYDPLAFEYAGERSGALQHAVDAAELLWGWADGTSAFVVNRPRHMAANGSKPFQARTVRAAGFRVPETLVTSDAEAADDFWRRHGRVVFKSLSGARSIVRTLEPHHQVAWSRIGTCPVQFQAYVPGTDYRVHTVGARAFAARIESVAVDYRYPLPQDGETRVVPVRLDDTVERRCLDLAHGNRLAVSGIDLRRTPSGEWFCFEVNPSPAFAYFDREGDVASAVAELLTSPDPRFSYPFCFS